MVALAINSEVEIPQGEPAPSAQAARSWREHFAQSPWLPWLAGGYALGCGLPIWWHGGPYITPGNLCLGNCFTFDFTADSQRGTSLSGAGFVLFIEFIGGDAGGRAEPRPRHPSAIC